MNPLFIGPLLDVGRALIERFFPDPAKKAEAEMELLKMQANGELSEIIAQLEINSKEALHPSIWVAGWRPYFGWVGGTAFAYATLIQPMLIWYGTAHGWPAPPDISSDLLWVVVTGLLGIGGLRSLEKVQGVSK